MDEDDGLMTDAEDAPPRHARAGSVDDSKLAPGTEVAGYLIDEEIGKGGMGHVYSATHRMIGKRAAIKVLKPDVSRSPIVVERFIQEARAVNQIHHPNIIDIFAFGALEDGRAYHIMDLLIGESLRKRLKRGPLIPSEAASVIEETALALTAAHEKGFVHRDLKPDNIFLQTREDRWPEVKLLDFGLAKLMPEAGFAPFKTKTGVMLGTPEYMSPEQARGTGVDYRTDIYALGVVMFEIMAGRRPFISQGDPFMTLMMHAEEPPPSLSDYVPDLPAEMVQLVDTMLAKDPAARPSLAAVRTVIKRLRTTQLPGRTLALELSQSRKPLPEVMEPADSIGDISASRLGADSILPGDSKPLPTLPSTVAGDRRISKPPHAAAVRPPSQPPPTRGSQPMMAAPDARQSGLAPTAGPNAPTHLSEPAIPLPAFPATDRRHPTGPNPTIPQNAGAFSDGKRRNPTGPNPSIPPTNHNAGAFSIDGNRRSPTGPNPSIPGTGGSSAGIPYPGTLPGSSIPPINSYQGQSIPPINNPYPSAHASMPPQSAHASMPPQSAHASMPPQSAHASMPPAPSVHSSMPGTPSHSGASMPPTPSAHSSMPGTPSHSGASMPPTSLDSIHRGGSLPPTPIGSLYPPAQSTHGARGNALSPKGPAGTELGVAPAPTSRPLSAVEPKSHLWIIVGAVVFIAAGIAIALVLVG